MAYATVSQVRTAGAIDEAQDHEMFRYATSAALDTVVARFITLASAWIRKRMGSSYDSVASDDLTLITEGESYLTLHFLFPILKSRKVTGTHAPLDQEESDRFEELIDVEWLTLAKEALEPYLTVEVSGDGSSTAFALPVFRIGSVIDIGPSSSLQDWESELTEWLDRNRGLAVPFGPGTSL